MSEPEPDDRAIWRGHRAARGSAAPSPCPDEQDLAAFLDGRAETQAERIEAHLVDCARCLEAVLEARQAEGEPLPMLPEPLRQRLQAIVARETTRRRPLGAVAGWAALAAALLLAGSTGFVLGMRTFADRRDAAQRMSAELSFGLALGAEVDPLPTGDRP